MTNRLTLRSLSDLWKETVPHRRQAEKLAKFLAYKYSKAIFFHITSKYRSGSSESLCAEIKVKVRYEESFHPQEELNYCLTDLYTKFYLI